MKSKMLYLWLLAAFFCSHIRASKAADSEDKINVSLTGATFLLNRINEGLIKTSVLNEHIIDMLKSLGSQIGKLEDQYQERNEEFRIKFSENLMRMEYMEKNLDAIKQGFDFIKCSHVQDKTPTIIKEQSTVLYDKIVGVVDNSSLLPKPTSSYPGNQTFTEEIPISRPLQTATIDPFDCADVLRQFGNKSGIYKIKPPHAKEPFEVYCNQELRGGGWTVFQNRFDGSVDFNKTWDLYKNGFGDLRGEFWLGLEKVHHITSYKINEIYFELEDWAGGSAFANYDLFVLGPESKNYPISVLGDYDGTAGDSFRDGAAGQPFTTVDRDNDKWNENCASVFTGAWWHTDCFVSCLNGNYQFNGTLTEAQSGKGLIWGKYGHSYSLKATKMMVRPRVNQLFNETG